MQPVNLQAAYAPWSGEQTATKLTKVAVTEKSVWLQALSRRERAVQAALPHQLHRPLEDAHCLLPGDIEY